MSKAQLVITAVVLSALNSRTRTCGLRKTLDKARYDAGAATIAEHLARDPAVAKVPAVSTIWRILSRRGFIIAQPQKRPRSAWKRFEAQQPNELCRPVSPTGAWPTIARWKSSTCFDDHSRVGLASQA
jgi:hypothetical protein